MVYEIVIPRLGWSMEEGTFVGWLKKDGDPIHRGDAVFELEGEKASQDVEAVDEGEARARLGREGRLQGSQQLTALGQRCLGVRR